MRLPQAVDTPLGTAVCIVVLPIAIAGTHAVVAELRAIARRRIRSKGHDPGGVD